MLYIFFLTGRSVANFYCPGRGANSFADRSWHRTAGTVNQASFGPFHRSFVYRSIRKRAQTGNAIHPVGA